MERSVFGGGGVAQSDSVSASAIVAQTVKGSHRPQDRWVLTGQGIGRQRQIHQLW